MIGHALLDALFRAQGELMDAAGQYSDDAGENPVFQDPDGDIGLLIDGAREKTDKAIHAFIHLNPKPMSIRDRLIAEFPGLLDGETPVNAPDLVDFTTQLVQEGQ